jgi:hypothetical protein
MRSPSQTQSPVDLTTGASNSMNSGEVASRAVAGNDFPASSAVAGVRESHEPPDPQPTHQIRSRSHQT